jgi:hypothetical protein
LDCHWWSIFFLSFLSLTAKVHNCPLYLLFFNFSPHSLNFLFFPYSFYRSFVLFFFNFIIQLQFIIYFVFHFNLYYFNFLFCFYSFYSFSSPKSVSIFGWCFRIHPFYFDIGNFFFRLSFIYLQFSPSILICVYYVFQFGPFSFDFLFFS